MIKVQYGSGICRSSIVTGLDPSLACQLGRDALEVGGGRLVGELLHKFTPHGITVVLIAAESHLVISTWPEWSALTLDISLCSPGANPACAWEFLVEKLCPDHSSFRQWNVSIPEE